MPANPDKEISEYYHNMQSLLLRHGARLQKTKCLEHCIKALEDKVEALEKSLHRNPNADLVQQVSIMLALNLGVFALCQVFARQQSTKFVCTAASLTAAVFLGTQLF